MFTMTMSTKGQFTLPREVRDHLKLHAGSKVHGDVDARGRVVLVPVDLTVEEFLKSRPKWPKRKTPITLEQMEAAIARGAARGRF